MSCPTCTTRRRCPACERARATTIVRIRSSWTRPVRSAGPR